MSYSKQSGRKTKSGKVRYKFSCTIGKERKRRQVTTYPSLVEKMHQAWEREVLSKNLMGSGPMFFQILDVFLLHVKNTKSKSNYLHYKSVVYSLIKVLMDDMPVGDIRRKHIQSFIERRKTICLWKTAIKPERVSSSTVNHTLNVLSSFFNWCIDQEYITMNPCSRLRARGSETRLVQLTPDQVDELLTKAYDWDIRFYYMVRIVLCTCFRFGEIMGLRWKNIDFENNRISLHWKRTKDRTTRVIPLVPSLKGFLLPLKGAPEDHVIDASYNAMQLVSKRLRPTLSFSQTEDGLIRFHDLRHVAGQYLFDQGVPIEDISMIMGHSSVTTTQKHYVHFPRPDMHEKMARIDRVLSYKKLHTE